MRIKVNLITMSDVVNFVSIATQVQDPVYLVGQGFRVSAKSLLGAAYTLEWDEIWCECAKDIYTKIEKFVVV